MKVFSGLGPFNQLNVLIALNSDRTAQAHGAARDHTSDGIFVFTGSPVAANCADTDGDGISGVTLLEFAGSDPRTGAILLVSVAPNDGDIDDSSRHPVSIRLADDVIAGWASFHRLGPEPPR